jgi:hypothetical protein
MLYEHHYKLLAQSVRSLQIRVSRLEEAENLIGTKKRAFQPFFFNDLMGKNMLDTKTSLQFQIWLQFGWT